MPTQRPELVYSTARPMAVPEYVEQPQWEVKRPARVAPDWWPSGMLEWFAVSQTLLPALLYMPGNQSFRFLIRAGAFVVSLGVWVIWWTANRQKAPVRHPAMPWLALVVMTLIAMLAHPDTPSLWAGVGQIALYIAVLCPLMWAPGYALDRRTLIRVLAILLVCNGINSIIGVLQVYDPVTWLPKEFSAQVQAGKNSLNIMMYRGPTGRLIARPPGLFDTPGAVCGPGSVAALLGLVFFLEPIAGWKRLVALAFSAAGMAAIYLSHVRAMAVIVVGMMVMYAVMLGMQNQRAKMTKFITLGAALGVGAFFIAVFLGGVSVQDRFASLFQGDPRDLYYRARGFQVETAFSKLLVDYPLGSGLARWGMITNYFDVPVSRRLWAEVQPPAWILDGGIFLFGAYAMALIFTAVWELKLVRRLRDPEDRRWAAAVVAANFGTLAMVFTFVPFSSQIGVQFWFLEGVLHGAMASRMSRWD